MINLLIVEILQIRSLYEIMVIELTGIVLNSFRTSTSAEQVNYDSSIFLLSIDMKLRGTEKTMNTHSTFAYSINIHKKSHLGRK